MRKITGSWLKYSPSLRRLRRSFVFSDETFLHGNEIYSQFTIRFSFRYAGFLSKLAETVVQQTRDRSVPYRPGFPTGGQACFQKGTRCQAAGACLVARHFAIQDFMVSLSESSIPDSVTLLFELFSVYRNYFPDEPFERFYPWEKSCYVTSKRSTETSWMRRRSSPGIRSAKL